MGLSYDARPGWLLDCLFAAWKARIAWHEVAETLEFVVGLLVVQSGSSFQ